MRIIFDLCQKCLAECIQQYGGSVVPETKETLKVNQRAPIDNMRNDELIAELEDLTGDTEAWEGVPTRSLRRLLENTRRMVDEREASIALERAAAHASVTPTVLAPTSVEIDYDMLADKLGHKLGSLRPTHDATENPGIVSRFAHPTIDPHFKDPAPKLSRVLKSVSDTGAIRNVLLTGPTGSGKTSWALQWAARHARPAFTLDCGTLAEPLDLFGHWEVRNGSTTFKESELVAALETPDCVVILDELNRTSSPKVMNALMGVLDDRRSVYVGELGRTVRVAPGVVLAATINEGAVYTGTDLLDGAIRNRATIGVLIDYLDQDDEVRIVKDVANIDEGLCEQIVMLGRNLRGVAPVSFRQYHQCAELIRHGLSIKDAAQLTFGIMEGVDEQTLNTAGGATCPEWEL